jgi:hypothetical protein
MNRKTTTADYWSTLVRWVVALAASAVDLLGHAVGRPSRAARPVTVPAASPRELSRRLAASDASDTSDATAPRPVRAVRRRAQPSSRSLLGSLAGFALPPSSPPSAATT